jgi:hypothetical protein
MIIGINGKSQHGKDTVGKIIQYLTNSANCKSDCGIKDYIIRTPHYDNHNWKIKKFAYKLKECVSVITGIPVEDLEKENVKNSNLGEEWNKEEIKCTFVGQNCPRTLSKECKDKCTLFGVDVVHMSVRYLLQKLGTECGRSIHENIWVNALMTEYDNQPCPKCGNIENFHYNYDYTKQHLPVIDVLCNECGTFFIEDSWIITDCRFPNEAKSIKDRGGILIKVIKLDDNGNDIISNDTHASETALNDYQFDYVIRAKHGDLDSLINQTKEILLKEKII